MAKVNAKVLQAVVDGKVEGDNVTISEKSAKYLERIGYVKILSKVEAKVADEKGKSAPKKSATKAAPKKASTKTSTKSTAKKTKE